MVSSFKYAHEFYWKSTASVHEENNWIAWFLLSSTCLSLLNLDTLEYRRLSSDQTLYYKVFSNLTPWSPTEYFIVSVPPFSLHSVSQEFHIRKPMCRNNNFENDFFNRCISARNSVPSFLVNSKSGASFKYNLRTIDLSSFLCHVF